MHSHQLVAAAAAAAVMAHVCGQLACSLYLNVNITGYQCPLPESPTSEQSVNDALLTAVIMAGWSLLMRLNACGNKLFRAHSKVCLQKPVTAESYIQHKIIFQAHNHNRMSPQKRVWMSTCV